MTKKTKTWQEEFNNKYSYELPGYVIEFIQSLLDKQKAEHDKQLREIDKRISKKRHTKSCYRNGREDRYCSCGAYDYNKAVKVKDRYLKELGIN